MSKKKGLCFIVAAVLSVSASTSIMALESEESDNNSNDTVTIMEDDELSFLHDLPTDQYCGYYYDENDQLVINVADKSTIAQGISLLSDDVPVSYQEVQYSWADIENAKRELSSLTDELKINGLGFDTVNNALSVFLEDNSETTKEKIRAICPIDNITFFDAAENVMLESDAESDISPRAAGVYGGKWLYNSDSTQANNKMCTLTISAVKDFSKGSDGWTVGILTVGHTVSKGDRVRYLNSKGTLLGTCSLSRNDADDVAFIPVSAANNPHGKVTDNNGNTLTVTNRQWASNSKNKSAFLYGAASGTRKEGTVLSINNSITTTGSDGTKYERKNLIYYSMVPDNGDSGAPIICDYFKDSSKKAIIGYCVARRGSTVETATGGWGLIAAVSLSALTH